METGTLKEVVMGALSYDPDTGNFTWRKTMNGRIKAGNSAGTLDRDGYRRIRLDGKAYYAHRLAWLAHYGELPDVQIDHINRDPDDNRIANLRLATAQQNAFNQAISANNTSGFKGVDFVTRENRWRARCRIDGRLIHLGTFATKEEAGQAYQRFAKESHRQFYCDEVTS